MASRDTCPHCGCGDGELHELFCPRELCPFCRNLITDCECIFTVLDLSEEERRVVEEYVDDSIDPLKGICERWERAVVTRGRIPFSA